MATTNVSSRSPRSIEDITGSGVTPLPRPSASQFSKGSVVSLRMKNFLVYKDVIATFGPRLNVVVGPNGSGKSTIVCAMFLGLGGPPKVSPKFYFRLLLQPIFMKRRSGLWCLVVLVRIRRFARRPCVRVHPDQVGASWSCFF